MKTSVEKGKFGLLNKRMILALYEMILADSEVHPDELKLFYEMYEQMGISEQDIVKELLSPSRLESEATLGDEEKLAYLYALAQMAQADQVVHVREKESLGRACERLGYDREAMSEFLIRQAEEGKTQEEVMNVVFKK